MSNVRNTFSVTENVLEQLAVKLDAKLPLLLDEVRDLLAPEWPDYAEFLDEHPPEVVEAGRMFVHRLMELAEHGPIRTSRDGDADYARVQLVFEQIGRQHHQDGSQLSELLGAYQVGARVAWRHVAGTALTLDLEPQVLAALAEAVFVFVDEFSAASAHGYVLAQSTSNAVRERCRTELADLLLSGRADTAGIQSAAQLAGWPLPAEAAIVLADSADADCQAVLERLDMNVLLIHRSGIVGAIVPDPLLGGRAQRLAAALRGHDIIIGHSVQLDLLPTDMHIAHTALRLRKRGILTDRPVIVDEQLDTIIANGDEWLFSMLHDQVLQPLREVPAGTRDRLIETLRCWLWNMGDRQAVARDLHIHPQTVRYRLGRLNELFGDRLGIPRERARLFLALIWDMPHGPPR